MKRKVEITREVKPFWRFNIGASFMIEKAKGNIEGSDYTIMASLLFSAFCFESYLNHLGNKKINFWNEIDRVRVMDKYSILCKQYDIEPKWGIRPYQTLKGLFVFRNCIAHGRTETISTVEEIEIEKVFKEFEPQTKWEEYCTIENAEKALEDIKKIITELSIAADEGEYAFKGETGYASELLS